MTETQVILAIVLTGFAILNITNSCSGTISAALQLPAELGVMCPAGSKEWSHVRIQWN